MDVTIKDFIPCCNGWAGSTELWSDPVVREEDSFKLDTCQACTCPFLSDRLVERLKTEGYDAYLFAFDRKRAMVISTLNGPAQKILNIQKACHCDRASLARPRWIIDRPTGKLYSNEKKITVWLKHLLLAIPLYPLATVFFMTFRVIRFAIGYDFWISPCTKQSFLSGVKNFSLNALKILVAPLTIVLVVLAALYGLVSPYDGRKLVATFERLFNPNFFILTVCYQPNATDHVFGGHGPSGI